MSEPSDRTREPEPSFGPDEEGEAPVDPVPGLRPRGAWVRTDVARHREEAERRAQEEQS